jgi:dihydrolipoamide dehydrogenase
MEVSMTDYDVIVIGAGPGGYPAAIRAAQLGFKTACIEREKLGGVCLNWGCVPSKALLKTAEMVNKLKTVHKWGIEVAPPTIHFDKVVDRSQKVAKRFNKGVAHLFKKYGVTLLAGEASFSGPHSLTVAQDGTTLQLTAKHIIIATGARAKSFPGLEPDGQRILTYREAIVLRDQPKSISILGAGAIGIEFAYFLNAMGTEVRVIEGLNEILPVEDAEIGTELRKHLKKQGIQFHLGQFVDRVENTGNSTKVTLKDGTTFDSELTLISLGITPNSDALSLSEVGIETERGFISVDTNFQTSVSGVYAVGDVCSRGPGLAHTATRAAHICVERIAGLTVADLDLSNVPSCTYCQPQVASVGMTEAQATAAGETFSVGRFPFMANAKAHGAGAPEGFVKVLVSEKYGEIIGAHIIGQDATEMIANFTMARSAEATADLFTQTIHAHPTNSEAMLEAVAAALGHSVHM